MNQFVAFIPVRGGSKSIPLKNIQKLNGRPLVYWTIDAVVQCPEISKVYVCTDSDQIREKVEEYISENKSGQKLVCINRPTETATDIASTESVMLYFAHSFENFENIVLVQATSPLLMSQHLSSAIQMYQAKRYDSMLSVVRQKRFCWQIGKSGYHPINYDYLKRPRRQEFDGYLVENGAFYINTREGLLRDECRLSGRIGVFEMEEETYFEIDEPSDWIIVEQLLRKREAKLFQYKKRICQIKMVLTDCDGVLTDGGMYYSESGDEIKKFNTKDGMAVELLAKHGIRFGIITGENIDLVIRRASKLKADECFVGIKDKVAVLDQICSKYGLQYHEIAYIGDDKNDVGILRRVGFPCCVCDGSPDAIDASAYITKLRGGKGALREVAELILTHRSEIQDGNY